jgi:DNA-binding IclR family transcriptional regulator
MDIIELLAEVEAGLTVSEIALNLKRRMSELFRIIVVMENRRWLQKDPATSRYTVTYHVLKLAHRGTPAHALAQAASQLMDSLSNNIDQSCHMVVRSGTQGLVILRQENPRRHANLSVRMGAVINLATSCSGHVLLAHMNPGELEALLPSLPRPRGLSRTKLERTLELVRKRGYEIQRSPVTAGVTDISYPVRGFDGKVAAALTVPYLHALDDSLPTSVEQSRRMVEETARQVSHALGWMQ